MIAPKVKNILTLTMAFALMCAASFSVNRSLLGHGFGRSQSVENDTATVCQDGSIVIHTGVLCSTEGYAGPTPLDVTVDKDLTVTDIKVLPNNETPRFEERAANVLDAWKGRRLTDNVQVDAVSGATYTSTALMANMQAAAAYCSNLTQAQSRQKPNAVWFAALVVTLCACILPLFVKNKTYLRVQLLSNVAVLGFLGGQYLDYLVMLRVLSYGASVPLGVMTLVMLVAAFIYPLFGRRGYYCANVCPLGSAQSLAGMVGKQRPLPVRLLKRLDVMRRILWVVLMLLLICNFFVMWVDFELFAAFNPAIAPVGVTIVSAAVLVLSLFVKRPYCRFVCPTGSLFKFAEGGR